jgi:hypothetical protein
MAAGQVRCGQCSAVFSAFDSLTDTLTQIPVDDSLQSTITEPTPPEGSSESANPIPPHQVFEVLEETAAEPQIPWHPTERQPKPEAFGWRIAATVAAAALLLQSVHYFRSSVAEMPGIGGALQRVYSLAGMPITEVVDPADFAIVDWIATAQTHDGSQDDSASTLEISAGVRNISRGPLPYPLLSLELTDRWEKTIGARVFTPEDYLGRRVSSNARIGANTTVQAQLQLVDPGPDAYGFEVDICIAVDANLLRCKNDAVFQ